jgi:hypothetical protein
MSRPARQSASGLLLAQEGAGGLMSNPSPYRGSSFAPTPSLSHADPVPDAIAVRAGRFAVVGDLQPTSGLEVWRESNHAERRTIVRAVAREKPDFLAMMGDLVFCGSSASAWADFDRLRAPLDAGRIPVMPVLGNHELWLRQRAALPNYFARFPHLRGRRWYAASYGPVGLVFLDSNFHWLSAGEWRGQLAWFRSILAHFDASPGTRGVLVFLHHPPFTNSRVTSDTVHVQRHMLGPFQEATKTLALLSGHVHSYERFDRAGKVFLVTGGGGGPRVSLAEGRRRRHSDDAFAGPPLRSFHYMNVSLADTGLEVEVLGLEKGGADFAPMDRFRLEWPAGSAAATP